MAKITREQCEAKGWFWNEKNQTCKRPRIGQVTMTLTRGTSCDGPGRRAVIEKALPLSVQNVLLKAGRKRKSSTG